MALYRFLEPSDAHLQLHWGARLVLQALIFCFILRHRYPEQTPNPGGRTVDSGMIRYIRANTLNAGWRPPRPICRHRMNGLNRPVHEALGDQKEDLRPYETSTLWCSASWGKLSIKVNASVELQLGPGPRRNYETVSHTTWGCRVFRNGRVNPRYSSHEGNRTEIY